ncbi:STAS domain-containing protein [Vibrio palustris]|uniref:RsbT co-antagonist protein RsbRB n=1 Tax=Vibrio palustris TaxID=1918946 RepID=A0A1R4B2B2_9VIBR|nr:STAS domain-containing protein [Vibrio palustris]SJL83036.1 RsbT co-antagonist protein RsbRB [Vibrio palustris]
MASQDVAISRRHIIGEVPMMVCEISDRCLYTGFFGSIDSGRMAQITDKITERCELDNAKLVIVDLANVDAIDTAVATHLVRLGKVLELVGVKVIFCGIKGNLARTMVTAGVEFDMFKVTRDLKSALLYSYEFTGLKLVPIDENTRA